ncbi:unnamed protein product [Brassica oleracea var. botrytis]
MASSIFSLISKVWCGWKNINIQCKLYLRHVHILQRNGFRESKERHTNIIIVIIRYKVKTS